MPSTARWFLLGVAMMALSISPSSTADACIEGGCVFFSSTSQGADDCDHATYAHDEQAQVGASARKDDMAAAALARQECGAFDEPGLDYSWRSLTAHVSADTGKSSTTTFDVKWIASDSVNGSQCSTHWRLSQENIAHADSLLGWEHGCPAGGPPAQVLPALP